MSIINKTRHATQAELEQLTKAQNMQTAINPITGAKFNDGTSLGDRGTAEAGINIDYDTELQRTVFHQAPFLSYCEQSGMVSSASVAKVGYRLKEQKTSSSFIKEDQDIPAHDPSLYDERVQKMSTLVYPIEVSDLSIVGVDAIDILEDEIQDGYLDMAETKDKSLLQGDGTNDDFVGFFNSVPDANKESMGGEPITKEVLDYTAQKIIDEGGSLSAIVTTANVGNQLTNLLYPTIRNIDKVELPLGFNVTSYIAPNQQQIPIIVDPNIKVDKNKDVLGFIDNSSFKIRELVPPSIKDLAPTKLSTSKVIYTYFTAYNKAPWKNGMITDIQTNVRSE